MSKSSVSCEIHKLYNPCQSYASVITVKMYPCDNVAICKDHGLDILCSYLFQASFVAKDH